MAYTNNWLRSQLQTQANPTKLPAPDPAHGQAQTDPYPSLHQAPPGADYGDTDFPNVVDQAPGLPLDTPPDSHDVPHAAFGTYHSQLERQQASIRAHDGTRDRGYVRQQYREPAFQDDTTRYLESSWEGSGSPAPNPVVLQRGINSLEANNPPIDGYDGPGFRRGVPRRSRVPFVDRKNFINQRVHTAQQLLARQIKVPQQQPAQDGAWGRTSPFASMARPMDTIAVRPALFHAPPSLTDQIIATEPAAAGDGGLATDGMWTVT